MQTNLRKDNVYNLLNKYYKDINHAKQVEKLSLRLFEVTKGLVHKLDDEYKELISAGALLHDIGYFLSSEDHHKNAYKLITRDGIKGFNPKEVEIIANIARYHRSVYPRRTHKNLSALEDKKTQKLMKKLASFVRIADGLDRSHMGFIEDVSAKYKKDSKVLCIYLKPKHEAVDIVLPVLIKKKDLFERVFEVQLIFKVLS